jgi:hypothetical protein
MLAELLRILLAVMKSRARFHKAEKLTTYLKKILLNLILQSIKINQISKKKMIDLI